MFKARQTSLNRNVSLKMILAGVFASEEDLKRFYRDAEAAALLEADLDHWRDSASYSVPKYKMQRIDLPLPVISIVCFAS